MHERIQDAMTYVRTCGRPTLLITMSYNPKWKEITDELLQSQLANHRPDIVARVFNAKKKDFMSKLTTDGVFRPTSAHVCAIEWQKRGLPHAHVLLWLSSTYQIRGSLIDLAISAELPDLAIDPELHTVLENMCHGPCGDINPSSPCITNGYCARNYPKEGNRHRR